MAPISSSTVWSKYLAKQQGGTGVLNGDWYEIEHNNHVLKYLVVAFGNQPATGYPLYIGLHGGGSAPHDKIGNNDGSWRDVFDRFYRGPIKDFATGPGASGAVFVATRGISALNGSDKSTAFDTYDLHSQPESYLLLQRMIANLVLPEPKEMKQAKALDGAQLNKAAPNLVDPDRVYLLGFSAGGDGAYQLASKIPDRFAAMVAGGGHYNWTNFNNIANMPLCVQCGEKDMVTGNLRARATIEAAHRFSLPFDAVTPKYWQGDNSDLACPVWLYRYECHIVKDGNHSQWAQPDQVNQPQKILTNLAAWYANHEAMGARDMTIKNINPTPWVSQFKRNPTPSHVVWDIASRPPHLSEFYNEIYQPERFFHYLYIHDPSVIDSNNKDLVFADYGSDYIRISNPTKYIALLLNEDMIAFDREFTVRWGNTKDDAYTFPAGSLKPSEQLQTETLEARGDPRLVFSVMLYFEHPSDNIWWLKTSGTLQTQAKAKL